MTCAKTTMETAKTNANICNLCRKVASALALANICAKSAVADLEAASITVHIVNSTSPLSFATVVPPPSPFTLDFDSDFSLLDDERLLVLRFVDDHADSDDVTAASTSILVG